MQRDSLDAIKQLNDMRLNATGDPEIATRINSFEMAFRMQSSRAGADGHFQGIAQNARNVWRRAGQTAPSPTTACWRADWSRRGVRFVQLYHEAWDQHGNLVHDLAEELP